MAFITSAWEFLRIFFLMTLCSSAYYSIMRSFKIYDNLFKETPVGDLTSDEQTRLDNLLSNAKKYYSYSVILSGVSLLISTLETFIGYKFPYGELEIPKEQTVLGLYVLSVLFLMLTDRFFLMSLPWLRLDKRRPPYDWLVMGFSFEKKIRVGFWYSIPLIISSISSGILFGKENDALGYFSFYIAGYGLIHSPRIIYYWSHLISEKLDHRGGVSTMSMNLLYRYRLIRQFIYSFYYVYPLILVIPNWNSTTVSTFYSYTIGIWGFLYIIREVGGIKRLRNWIDKKGKRFGFAIESQHYK